LLLASLTLLRPPSAPRFPYTTLFRSVVIGVERADRRALAQRQGHVARALGHVVEGDEALARHLHQGAPHRIVRGDPGLREGQGTDRKSTRLNSSHVKISYAVFCLKKK